MTARRAAGALIVLATVLAYGNSFAGVFLFDEHIVIVENARIRDVWPPWPYVGHSLRPLLYFTLAVNYAVGGLDPWSYHAFNLAAHVLSALLLFGVVRRTMLLPRWQGRHDADAVPVAFSVALLWAVHPLNTQSVTYVVQRGEVMAAAFGLLALWCVINAAAGERRWPAAWYAAAIAALAAGLSAKETAIAWLPVLLVFDRALLAGSWREALARRWPLYAGVVAMPAAVALARWAAGVPLLFAYNVKWPVLTYLSNQGLIVLHYLRLAFWPSPLVFDYGWQPLAPALVVAGVVATGALLLGAFAWLRRRPAVGAAGVSFFLLLAPTSSIMPIEDLAVEHRMYLPLAAVIIVAVVAARALLIAAVRPAPVRRIIAVAVVTALASSAIVLTRIRNYDYFDELSMWEDTLAKRPRNARAFYNAGVLLASANRFATAGSRFEQAIAIDPEYAQAHSNLAVVQVMRGNLHRAEQLYREAIRLNPALPEAHQGLGKILAASGRVREAVPYYEAAVALATPQPALYLELGRAKAQLGELAEARALYERALQRRPNDVEAHNSIGLAWAAAGQADEAMASYMRALAIAPGHAPTHNNLAAVLAQRGSIADAAARYREALRLDPALADAHHNLGLLLAQSGDVEAAIQSYRRALALRPDHADAHVNLGTALAGAGRFEEAVAAYRSGLMLRPDYAEAHNNLGAMLLHLHRPYEAAMHFEKALAIRPGYDAARRNLLRATATALIAFDAPARQP